MRSQDERIFASSGEASGSHTANPHPEPEIRLQQHSYLAGFWNADEMSRHQHLEGARRQVAPMPTHGFGQRWRTWDRPDHNDNYLRAVQAIDRKHADERLWKASKAAIGEGTPPSQAWVEQQAERLWNGGVGEVVTALHALDWSQSTCPDDIRESPAYLETRQSKMNYDYLRQAGFPIDSGTS